MPYLDILKIVFMKKCFALLFFVSTLGYSQNTKNVLFLGNSYTNYNDLPKLIEDIAASQGDVLTHNQNTPGGKSLQGHSTDAASMSLIKQGGWDYVVLQDQSQRPSFSPASVSVNSLPYARLLSDTIYKYSPCGEPLFYMTWGRKNGDASNCASYPPVCTYAGMQARLRSSYLIMGQENSAPVSPVGAVWRDFLQNNPTVELYNADESHPSLNGSYLAACTFYAAIYHKSPVGAWKPTSMSSSLATAIQTQVANTVFDSLSVWRIDTSAVPPKGTSVNLGGTRPQALIQFFATDSLRLDSVRWFYGNGLRASGFSASDTFTIPNGGNIFIYSEHWRKCQVSLDTIRLAFLSAEQFQSAENMFSLFPNPCFDQLAVESDFQGVVQFRILSVDGKLVQEGKLENQVLTVTELSRGEYILLLEAGGTQYSYRFVKQ
jgi:hypothetical protein